MWEHNGTRMFKSFTCTDHDVMRGFSIERRKNHYCLSDSRIRGKITGILCYIEWRLSVRLCQSSSCFSRNARGHAFWQIRKYFTAFSQVVE